MSLSAEKPILREHVEVGRVQRPLVIDPYNRRFKLIDWTAEEVGSIGLPEIRAKAGSSTKGIVYSKSSHKTPFETLGFNLEATIEGFFSDGSNAYLYSCFLDAQRGRQNPNERVHECLRLAREKEPASFEVPAAMTARRAMSNDAEALHRFLSENFEDYPTPIDADYLANEMERQGTYLRVCMFDGEIVASASAEIDHENMNAEISDCATRADVRGKGIVSALVQQIERDVNALYGITDFYSLARGGEVGMNCAIAKCGYTYNGRLVNNCRMPNGWESIHVWCRSYAS